MFDLVFRNARIVDGRGGPPYKADLGVHNGRVAAIGHNLENGTQDINADGLALAPGIVDIHTHYDAQLTWDQACTPSPALGVTTVAIGAPERVHDLPAGESRIIRHARGLAGVWINGVQVYDGDDYLDHASPPGQVLTDFAA